MEIRQVLQKTKNVILKYKYVFIVLMIGVVLMLLPGIEAEKAEPVVQVPQYEETPLEDLLSQTLSKVYGAGKVEVMLNVAQGEKTIYQVDADISESASGHTGREETVTLTDGQRNQYGLIQQVNPPIYLGAIILCQGADDPVVKLSVVEAVAKITGLNANQICVLKMK